MRNWKRLYVFGALCCVAGVSSCFDRKDELPTSILPSAQAAELSPSVSSLINEHTRAIELRFEAGRDTLERASETALENFLRDPNGRPIELKVIVWVGSQEEALAQTLAERRATFLKEKLGREIPVTVVKFAEREASQPEAAVLAVLE
ncbi:MAG: hypothetical protein EOP11_21570 [Proteobacteria bacterium]|nr:MAG: hypothetical protein EOP11_21570 [Pseudomonadota bacterium]